jgi:copper resistance protein C
MPPGHSLKELFMTRLILSSVAALVFSAAVAAHAHLQKSTPADKSVISAAPTTLALTFSLPVRLTAVTIQKGGGKSESLAPLPEKPAASASIAVPKLTPGDYVVSWRAVSDDNHVMSGNVTFTLSAGQASAPGAAAKPDDHSHRKSHDEHAGH